MQTKEQAVSDRSGLGDLTRQHLGGEMEGCVEVIISLLAFSILD